MSDRENVGTIAGLVGEARRNGVATQLARLEAFEAQLKAELPGS